MSNIPGYKVCIFFLAFFHNNLIKKPVFGIRQCYIQFISIYINSLFNDCFDNRIYNIFRQMKFGTP